MIGISSINKYIKKFSDDMKKQKFVNPKAGESESEFISRCMADSTMNSEYPEQSQRAAVCYAYWKKD
jgi:hypothetical protein